MLLGQQLPPLLTKCCFGRETSGKKDPGELGLSLSYACMHAFIYSAQCREAEVIKTYSSHYSLLEMDK